MRPFLFGTGAALAALGLLFVSAQADTPDKLKKGPGVETMLKGASVKLTKLPAGLTDAKVKAHVLAPAHLKNVTFHDWTKNKNVRLKVPAALVLKDKGSSSSLFLKKPHLDVAAFQKTVHAMLKDKVAGYMFEVRKDGKTVNTSWYNWARTKTDGDRKWSADARMHIASVSKYLTAIAMVQALDKRGLSYDTKIINYLPAYWKKGKNIDKITFRHLLTQRSGFNSGGKSDSNFAFMKGMVASGVAKVGDYHYENMNFGLCRILIAVVNGNVSRSANFLFIEAANDAAWDLVTQTYYMAHMQSKVFAPAGVSNVGFAPAPSHALAYLPSYSAKAGWESGNLAPMAGTAGFRMTTKELLNVLNHARRKGTLLSSAKAQMMLDSSFGIDLTADTRPGKIYAKSGWWGLGDGRTEQCVIFFLPEGMELALFVNSKVGNENASLMGVVEDAYRNSIRGLSVSDIIKK